jgi:multiple sugar transport system ATP-binding protein
VEVAVQAAELDRGARVTLGIRPEHMQLAAPGSDEPNRVPVSVGHVEYLGDQSILYAQLPGVEDMLAVRHGAQGLPPQAGSAAELLLPPAHCLLFDAAGNALPRTET